MFNNWGFIKKNLFLLLLFFFIATFFTPLFKGFLPIPTDTIVGLYHPYRDLYAKNYPNGIPFKNFLLTDPVRQTYPWKNLAIDVFSSQKLPIWNPYEMSGKPLLGNFQTGAFYPLNLILFIHPFYFSWSIFIVLQLFLGALFMYLFLNNLKLDNRAAVFGALTLTFSGFFVAWLEWGNILNTAIWLPLILFSIDRSISSGKTKWVILTITWLIFSFFAGHLQTFFYLLILSFAYFVLRISESKNKKTILSFAVACVIFLALTSIQWVATLRFILLSARNYDLIWNADGWFVPFRHLIQFIVPDFFGNPTTLNYFSTWSYAEMVGFIGVVPLVFAFYSFFTKQRRAWFFALALFISLLFSIRNPISELPFTLNIPFISTAQPTRLLFISCFSLSVLCAFGFNNFIEKLKEKKVDENIFIPLSIISLIMLTLWIMTISFPSLISKEEVDIAVSKRNLIFPSLILALFTFLLILNAFFKKYRTYLLLLIIILSAADLLRFANKFEPFGRKEYLYPTTKTIKFLQNKKDIFRIAADDRRILPPNFSTIYKLQSIEGYDPLYLLSYAKYVVALERGNSNINPPFGFNRIITPHNIGSNLIDLLNVKYILSFSEIKEPKFQEVFREGKTIVYENKKVLKRAFFVESTEKINSENDEISKMLESDLSKIAFGKTIETNNYSIGTSKIVNYSENEINVETNNEGEGFLFISDNFYPTWKATIDGNSTTIYKTNLTFRGIVVPKGKHEIKFYTTLF